MVAFLGDSTVSMLSVGRRLGAPGIGLSGRARALNNQFLSQTNSFGNALLSAGVASDTQTLLTQIKGIQSTFSTRQQVDAVLASRASAERAEEAAARADAIEESRARRGTTVNRLV